MADEIIKNKEKDKKETPQPAVEPEKTEKDKAPLVPLDTGITPEAYFQRVLRVKQHQKSLDEFRETNPDFFGQAKDSKAEQKRRRDIEFEQAQKDAKYFSFEGGEVLKAIPYGAFKAIGNTADLGSALVKGVGGGDVPRVTEQEWFPSMDPRTNLYADIIETGVQFFAPFAVTGKLGKPLRGVFGPKLSREQQLDAVTGFLGTKLTAAQKKRILSSKGAGVLYETGAFISKSAEYTLRGAVVDATAFDPAHGNLSNMLKRMADTARLQNRLEDETTLNLLANALHIDVENFDPTSAADQFTARSKMAIEGGILGVSFGALIQLVHLARFKAAAHYLAKDLDKMQKQYDADPSKWTEKHRKNYAKTLGKILDLEERAFRAGVSVLDSTAHLREGSTNHGVSHLLSDRIKVTDETLLVGPESPVLVGRTPAEAFGHLFQSARKEGAELKVLSKGDPESEELLKVRAESRKEAGLPERRAPAFIVYGKKGKPDRIVLDPDAIETSFANKAWNTPKVEGVFPLETLLKDLGKEMPLADAIAKGEKPLFKDKNDWAEWLIEHELAHHRQRMRKTKFKNLAEKENATNIEALKIFLNKRSGNSLEELAGERKLHNVAIAEDHGTLWKIQDGDIVIDDAAAKADYHENMRFLRGTSSLDGSYNEGMIMDALGVSTLGLKQAFDRMGGPDAYVRFLTARAKILADEMASRGGGFPPSLGTNEGMALMMKVTKEALLDPKKGLNLNERSISQTTNLKLKDSFDAEVVPFEPKEMFKEGVDGAEEFGKYLSGRKQIKGEDGKLRNFTLREAIADMKKRGLFNPDTMFSSEHGTNKSLASIYKMYEKHFAENVENITDQETLIRILGLKAKIQEGGDINSVLAQQNEKTIDELAAALRTDPEIIRKQILEGRGVFEGTFTTASNRPNHHPLLEGEVETLHLRLGAYRLVLEENAARLSEVTKEMAALKNELGDAIDGNPKAVELANEFVALKNSLKEDLTAIQKTRRSWGLAGRTLQRDLGSIKNADGSSVFSDEAMMRINLEILDASEGGLKNIYDQATTIATKNQADGTLDDGLAIIESVNRTSVDERVFSAISDWRVNSMLMSFKTQGVNIVGTTLRTYNSILSKYLGTRDWPILGAVNHRRFKEYGGDGMTREQMEAYGNAYTAAMYAGLNEYYSQGIKLLANFGVPTNFGRKNVPAGKRSIAEGGASEADIIESQKEAASSGQELSSRLEVGDSGKLNADGRGIGTHDSKTEDGVNSTTLLNIIQGNPGDWRHDKLNPLFVKGGLGTGGPVDDFFLGFDKIVGATIGAAMRGMVTADEYIKQAYYRMHLRASVMADMVHEGTYHPDNMDAIAQKIHWISELGTLDNGQYFNVAGLWQQAGKLYPNSHKSQQRWVQAKIKEIESKTGMGIQAFENLTKGAFRRAKEVAWQRKSNQNIMDLREAGSSLAQGNFKYGEFTQKLQDIAYSHSAFGAIITPFVLTPANIGKFVAQHTVPLDYGILRRLHQNMSANLASGDKDRIADANGKIWMGLALWGTGIGLSMSGQATGAGPRNKSENKVWRETHQPYSIKTPGGGSVQYNRADPYSWFVAIPASISEAMRRARTKEEEVRYRTYAMIWVSALTKAASEKTYVQPLANFLKTFTDTEKNLGTAAEQYAASFMPSVIKDMGKGLSPTFTEARNYIDRLHANYAGVPFFYEELGEGDLNAPHPTDPRKQGRMGRKEYRFGSKAYAPVDRNHLGEPRYKRGEAHWQLLQTVFNPLPYEPPSKDPVYKELARIQYDSELPKPKLDGVDSLDRTAVFAEVQQQDKKTRDLANIWGVKHNQDLYDYWLDLSSKIRLGELKDLSGKSFNFQRMNNFGAWIPEVSGKKGLTLRQALLELMASEKYQREPVYTSVSSGEESKRIAMIDLVLTQYRNAAWEAIVGQPKFMKEENELGQETLIVNGYDGILGKFWPRYELNLVVHKGNSEVTQKGSRNSEHLRDIRQMLEFHGTGGEWLDNIQEKKKKKNN